MSVQFGLFLTNQHPVGTDQVTALREQITIVHAARDNGWDMLWAGQHFLAEGMTHIQPLAYLARLAPETGTMRVGIGINLLSLLNPVDVAENYAALGSRGNRTWFDAPDNWGCAGFICEWKDK